MKQRWLDRTLTRLPFYYCLRITEETYFAELKKLKIPIHEQPEFLSKSMNGCCRRFICPVTELPVVIVCIRPHDETVTGIQVAALLVHEAVHVWQRHAEYIGAHNDHGDEEEAYAIQSIAQNLMFEYARLTGMTGG